jgi:pyruvate kinase
VPTARQTKIIATVGPASAGDAAIRELVVAGVDVFRLNFSHGTRQAHGEVIARVRRAAREAGRQVAILQDVGGPKIRTGRLEGGAPLPLAPGDVLRIVVSDEPGRAGVVTTSFGDLPRLVRPGAAILFDDGRIHVRVERVLGREIVASVVDGGLLGEHKGVNVPGIELPVAGLTPKDLDDLAWGAAAGVDLLAVSFVQGAADLQQARDALASAGAGDVPVVAKLERPAAIARLDEILAAADAVMVARGDLGLELPLERVPRIQKEATRRARARGIPVIVATQVLESMRSEPRPTRAEVSDAANAVDDGVDAIMLAGETAIGRDPARAVRTLDAIIGDAESIPPVGTVPLGEGCILGGHGRALCEAAVTLAHRAAAAAIVAVTRGGKTARLLSALRSPVPIFAATPNERLARRLVLWRGVVPVVAGVDGALEPAAARVCDELVARGLIPTGSTVVLVSITSDLARGTSNFLILQRA